jgi:hypothetical protein
LGSVQPVRTVLTTVLTVLAAVLLGFGIPLFWVWVGSQVQGHSGGVDVDFSVAMIVLFGIILSYVGILYIAGWLMARRDAVETTQRSTSRTPWLRGHSDTRALARHRSRISGIERLFVSTTLIVSAAAFIWFFLFAEGGGLPRP